MRLLSVQVGQPREVTFGNQTFRTAFRKDPVGGPVRVMIAGVDGDRQADERVHGGPDKAVYAYSREAYAAWPLPGADQPGSFGENLTLDAFDEANVYLGDRWTIGSCILEVAQPRIPCFKLNARFGDPTAITAFNSYRRPGVYFRVVGEGYVNAGDPVQISHRDPNRVSVLEAWDLVTHRRMPPEVARRALEMSSLNTKLRQKIERLP